MIKMVFGIVTEKKLIQYFANFEERLGEMLGVQGEDRTGEDKYLDQLRNDIISEPDPRLLKLKLEAYKLKKRFISRENQGHELMNWRNNQELLKDMNNEEMQSAVNKIDPGKLGESLAKLDPQVVDNFLDGVKLPGILNSFKPAIKIAAKAALQKPETVLNLVNQAQQYFGSKAEEVKMVGKVTSDSSKFDPTQDYPISQ